MLTWLRTSAHESTADNEFDGIGAIYAHLEFRRRLENYMDGESKELIKAAAGCHAGCALGKWLHGEGGRNCKDVDLVDSLCNSCEEFCEAAVNAVLLKNMGEVEMAKAALQDGERLAEASDRFQSHMVRMHQQYSTKAHRFSP